MPGRVDPKNHVIRINFDINEKEAIARDRVEKGYYLMWLVYHNDIKPLQKEFEAGHKASLMMCIKICAEYFIPLPDWAATAYMNAFESVRSLNCLSWDDAFERPFPKNTNASALRKKIKLASIIWSEVVNEKNAGRAIDIRLFEDVGRRHGIGKTLAGEYYYYFIDWLKTNSNAIYLEL